MSADTRDDNMFASVTSADSVTEHIQCRSSSMSSIFFWQEQCLVILKLYTLLREQDKIIVDTQEINLQDHLLVYFDFNLRK